MANNKRWRLRKRLGFKFNENKKQKHRSSTLTKHIHEIFKRANDLCTLTGIDIVVLITSLCGRTYCFAHPNVESVQSQFLYQTLLPKSILEPYKKVHIEELYTKIDEVRNDLKFEEKRGRILKEKKDKRPKKVWEDPIPELSKIAAESVKQRLRQMQSLVSDMRNQKFRSDQALRGVEECASTGVEECTSTCM